MNKEILVKKALKDYDYLVAQLGTMSGCRNIYAIKKGEIFYSHDFKDYDYEKNLDRLREGVCYKTWKRYNEAYFRKYKKLNGFVLDGDLILVYKIKNNEIECLWKEWYDWETCKNIVKLFNHFDFLRRIKAGHLFYYEPEY